MTQPKKLIEVAMPIKEISAESVRDGRIQHGHISSLHKWWARRPLPVCRAVVFASLIPDPLDENCPQIFKDAVELLLGRDNNPGDPYKPYDDIPYTAALDKMDDNLRNRLLMFIGKFSERFILNERLGKKTDSKDQLSDASLIKWDNKNNVEIIKKARKLIWVANNYSIGHSTEKLLAEFDKSFKAIKEAEADLCSIINRHIKTKIVIEKEAKLQNAKDSFLDKMPKVFDPFAGGGAIPLEAARLGCRSFGNDINPVAHIIQKGGVEFPQKFGKPINYSKKEFINLYGEIEYKNLSSEFQITFDDEKIIRIPNRLSFDVAYYSAKILDEVKEDMGHFYPTNDKGQRPHAYYWGRVGICSNPSCKAEIPLLKQFYLVNTKNKQIYLKPVIKGNKIDFEIKPGKFDSEGWISRGNLVCPCCGNSTDVSTLKQQFLDGKSKERLLAVIWEGVHGKEYKIPQEKELDILSSIPLNLNVPQEKMPVKYTQALPSCTWGLESWGQMFSPRQLLTIQSLVAKFNLLKYNLQPTDNVYYTALVTYLGIWIDRLAARLTTYGLIDVGRETIVDLFGRQTIPMIFDYPELSIFSTEQISWIIKVIESESFEFDSVCNNASSGEKSQFSEKFLTAVITDPPYYDAIAYADLSDFFYIWLKRTLSDVYPYNFSTPQTPKSDECTALKHHHDGNIDQANSHFETKLLKIFDAIEHQTSDIVCIMFAHQSTEAWTTLCNSILGARMNITGSWCNDTETTTALKSNKAFLSSSVTVSCRPAQRVGIGNFKDVKKTIEETVAKKVGELYRLGFRGADLLTACFGQAVSEFGKYEKVEKADGNEVTVADLLDLARESAFNALLKGFDGDDFTKFYIGWLQLYGFTETDFDDAAKFSRVGLTIDVSDLFIHNIFIKKGNKQELTGYVGRLSANHKIGEGKQVFIIDSVHKAMGLYAGTNRNALLEYITKVASLSESSFWRVVTSLCEVLPQGSDDLKQATGLLLNKDSLIRESKNIQQSTGEQGQLF
jgi:adenine-specific DNA methylase